MYVFTMVKVLTHFKVLESTTSTLSTLATWYSNISTQVLYMVTFKRYLSTSTNVLGPMPVSSLHVMYVPTNLPWNLLIARFNHEN